MKETKEYIRTVTTKGQVTIPAEVRRRLDLEPGDQGVFRIVESTVELQPITMTLEETFGAVSPINRLEDFAALRNMAIEEHVQKVIDKMAGN